MSFDVNERISSLLDGELDAVDRKKVIDQIRNSHEHLQAFGRYCMIGQALKRNLPSLPTHDLFARVQAALESEPTLLSPSPSSVVDETRKAEVVSIATRENKIETSSSKTVVGFAVAASLALMTVVGFQFMSSSDTLSTAIPVAQIQSAPSSDDIQIVQIPNESVVTSTSPEEPLYAEQSVINDGQWTRITHIGNLSLNGKLGNHQAESHANNAIQGNSIPFTRAVNLENAPSQ